MRASLQLDDQTWDKAVIKTNSKHKHPLSCAHGPVRVSINIIDGTLRDAPLSVKLYLFAKKNEQHSIPIKFAVVGTNPQALQDFNSPVEFVIAAINKARNQGVKTYQDFEFYFGATLCVGTAQLAVVYGQARFNVLAAHTRPSRIPRSPGSPPSPPAPRIPRQQRRAVSPAVLPSPRGLSPVVIPSPIGLSPTLPAVVSPGIPLSPDRSPSALQHLSTYTMYPKVLWLFAFSLPRGSSFSFADLMANPNESAVSFVMRHLARDDDGMSEGCQDMLRRIRS